MNPLHSLPLPRAQGGKISQNPEILLMFQHAYEQVDSSETSGIGAATAQSFLTETEGQDGTDEADTNDAN